MVFCSLCGIISIDIGVLILAHLVGLYAQHVFADCDETVSLIV